MQKNENLCRQGYIAPLSPDEFTTLLEKPAARHSSALVALLQKYGDDKVAESPGKVLTDAGISFETNDTAAVVDAAHRCGAICLVAHPGRCDGFLTYDTDLLDQLRQEIPVDGLEVYYPVHSAAQINLYRDYAHQHQWLTSSGSDSHSIDRKPIKYRAELSRALLERVGIQIT